MFGREEIEFTDVFSKDVIKQVLFGLCHFGLPMGHGWGTLLCLCYNRMAEIDGRKKIKSIFKYFFTARKITENVDLCSQFATKPCFAVLEVLTRQSGWDSSSQQRWLQHDLALGNAATPNLVSKALQGYGSTSASPHGHPNPTEPLCLQEHCCHSLPSFSLAGFVPVSNLISLAVI